MLYGLAGSLLLSAVLISIKESYVNFYSVEEQVKDLAARILLLLSLEECVRLAVCLWVFRKRKWMKVLGEEIVRKKE